MTTITPTVAVLDCGLSNLASVTAALSRAGARAETTASPDTIRRAERLVLPGVGAFGRAMTMLRQAGVVDALRARLAEGRSTLAICLGFQLLCTGSEEAPGVEGLGIFPTTARRFAEKQMAPHFGWSRLTDESYAYFAHSYYVDTVPDGWRTLTGDNAGRFVALAAKEGVVGCQFHPELSGSVGADLISAWVSGRSPL